MKRILIAAVIVMAMAFTALVAADTARERKLQQAIDLMETKGDVAKAMPLLEDVAKSSDKALAARGLLYLGQAQERQGGDRARATYQRIVREFGNQRELVAAAQQRLDALGGASQALRARQLPFYVDDFGWYPSFSPDGQWILGTDWIKGDLVLRNIATGEIRRLVTGGWAQSPAVSPDGRQVAFMWQDDAQNSFHDQLRVVANEPGAKPRVVLNSKPGEYQFFKAAAWSRDGKSILVGAESGTQSRGDYRLAWVSVSDGAIRIIKNVEAWRSQYTSSPISPVSLSPDGRYIAYAARMRQDSAEMCIYVLSADGSSESELIRGDINEEPIWTPDGSRILFSSNRSGSFGIWSIPVQNGKRAGVPLLIKAETGRISGLGMTRAGTYYYRASGGLNQIFVAEMGASVKVTDSFVGIRPRWSRDGKWLAFKRLKNGAPNNEHDLVIHSMQTGAEWAFSPRPMGAGLPQWYLNGTVQPISNNPFLVGISSGEPKELIAARAVPLDATLSPDDKLSYRSANRDPQKPRTAGRYEGIEAVDTATGERKSFIEFPKGIRNGPAPALSPDGRTLVVALADQGLARIGVDGTGMRTLYTGPVRATPNSYSWTRDGRAILFAQPGDGSTRIMRIAAEGGQPEYTGITANALQTFDLSPDGAHIAYEVRSNPWELWALDNVASAWGGK